MLSLTDDNRGALVIATQAGQRVVALIEERLEAGQSLRNFALQHGLDHTRFFAWRQGTTPSLDQLRQVATAIGMRLGDVLVECGYGTRDEFSVVEVVEYVSDVQKAIETDPNLDEHGQQILRAAFALWESSRTPEGSRRSARTTVRVNVKRQR